MFSKPEMRQIILLSQVSSRTGAASLTRNRKCSLYILWMFVWALTPVQSWQLWKHKMCPHSLEAIYGTSGVSTKSAFYLLSTKAPPEKYLLTAARVLTSRRSCFESDRSIFAVDSGLIGGEEMREIQVNLESYASHTVSGKRMVRTKQTSLNLCDISGDNMWIMTADLSYWFMSTTRFIWLSLVSLRRMGNRWRSV